MRTWKYFFGTMLMACVPFAANAQFFNKVYPKISYKTYLIVFSLFSGVIANFGLENLLEITLPALMILSLVRKLQTG